MMALPPGEPTTRTGRRLRSKTIVGAIELRGRLPASTRLATGLPFSSGAKEKSVSWLLRRKPRTIRREPKPSSIVVVIETALPRRSTIETCVVDGSSSASSVPRAAVESGGVPGCATLSEASGRISAARLLRYPRSIRPLTGTGTKSESAI
jgi:hypothetical protein